MEYTEYRLYCGAEATSGDIYPEGEPFQPHITFPPLPTTKQKRSNWQLLWRRIALEGHRVTDQAVARRRDAIQSLDLPVGEL
jgi:hypothetical protein